MAEPPDKIRLQLFLSRSGIASRRKSAELIEKGLVKVNGEVIKEPYHKVEPDKDTVEFAGKNITLSKYRFYKMNKPPGYLSSMSDDRGRKTIADLIPKSYGRLFPVGRLDLDSEGLIILTNHGDAANRMIHPRFHFSKVYHVTLDKSPDLDHLDKMSKGIMLEGKKTIAASYERIGGPGSKRIRVEIVEGRKRQIKMVFREFDYKVTKLRRIAIGPVKLGNTQKGSISELTMNELIALLDELGLSE